MDFYQLIEGVRHDTLDVSLPRFGPELALCVTIVAMLLARLPRWGGRLHAFWIAMAGSITGVILAEPWHFLAPGMSPERVEIFGGLLVYDGLTVFFRSVLLVFAVLLLVLTRLSGIPDREDSPDFYTLVLGATLGMCIMASANHMITLFMGVEIASVPSFALAGIMKGRRTASEAALKYAIYGAGTAGVMLYGISLLAGALGSVHLPTMAHQLATLSADALAERQLPLVLGGLMVAVGLAFKLSAVPFHFWCPDVFEGATAEVNAFLSVASKAAALALLVRVGLGFASIPPTYEHQAAHARADRAAVAGAEGGPAVHRAAYRAEAVVAQADEPGAVPRADALRPVQRFVAGLIALLAAITCTFGNLAAYGQTNIKRLLAYSTIAHAGYMMMPVAAAVAMIGQKPAAAQEAVAAVCFYVGVYLFMNLGAFAVVALLRNAMRSEEIADYAGLIRACPGVVICFGIILFSLLGMPPLSGFVAKVLAFAALVQADEPMMYSLLVIGALNTVLSLFYYLRVVKTMALDPEPQQRLPVDFSLVSPGGVYLALVTAPVVVLGVFWNALNAWAQAAAAHLLL